MNLPTDYQRGVVETLIRVGCVVRVWATREVY